MEIKITQTCGVHGEVVEKDEVVDVDDATAKTLIGMGKAESAEAPVPANPTIKTQDPGSQNQDPKITNSDPQSDMKP